MPRTTARTAFNAAAAPISRCKQFAIAQRPFKPASAIALTIVSIFLLALPHLAHADNTGLVGYWKFDDGTGTQATDFSGNGNTGTLTTTGSTLPTWTSGKHGKALSFDGSSSYISASGPALAANAPFSICAWAYLDPGYPAFPMLVDDGGIQNDLLFGVNTAGTGFSLYVHGIFAADGSTPAIGTWYHVCGLYDGSHAYIYKNGSLQATSPSTGAFAGTTGVLIGNGTEGGNSFWKGKIDDVRIYNRALSATEVAKLYTAGATLHKPPNNLGLVGYWSFDDATGTQATDFSGNGFTGTLSTTGSTIPTWVSGKHGEALLFRRQYELRDRPPRRKQLANRQYDDVILVQTD